LRGNRRHDGHLEGKRLIVDVIGGRWAMTVACLALIAWLMVIVIVGIVIMRDCAEQLFGNIGDRF
jgi:hypothetical protein